MSYAATQEVHEVFFKERTFREIRLNYEKEKYKEWSQEELLLTAKAYFISLDYHACMAVLQKMNPEHSSKVLFESQSLAFRAMYLDNRQREVTKFLLAKLNKII